MNFYNKNNWLMSVFVSRLFTVWLYLNIWTLPRDWKNDSF